ncbi:MAG TPA: SDR family oxidoreductase [Solirubrobacteraceae bacterium]|nr:SDR family oxidoreductase [Solirubrobacteraceae bacterium]
MRVALVTGATSGIGRAAAVALAADGWWVAAHGRDEARGREVADELGDRGAFFPAELDASERLVDAVVEARGRLDLLVNNAAVYARDTVADLRAEDLDRLLAVNVRAAVLLAGAAVRAMGERGGVVVSVASEAGLVAVPGQVAYNVTKAALIMLSRSIAVDHAAAGIRAVSVCPGTTRTPLVDAAIAAADDPAAHERTLEQSRPLGRLGTPEEIAAAIVFAASPEAGFMTGSELVIDGGYTAA